MYDKEFLKDAYRRMTTIRAYESKVEEIFLAGELPGFTHLYIGEEACGVGVCENLNDDDYIESTHRGHGHCIAKGMDTSKMMAELFGRETGYCRGRGGSLHVADVSKGILGANGIVGGGIPIATGSALTSWIEGTNEVTACFFGEGASNEGTFHESINMAAIWDLPIVYICENNQWAVNTPATAVLNTEGVAERAAGYGIPGVRVDGNDVEAVFDAVSRAVQRARNGEGPSIVELYTFRMRAHNSADKEIRPQELRDAWEEKSPIKRLKAKLLNAGIAENVFLSIEAEADAEIENAYQYAVASPYPAPETICENVYRNDNERSVVR